MSERRYRVLAVASHPVQYMSPIFRRMAKHPRLELQVAYCTLRGAEEGYDPEFGAKVKWDVPLLDGYPWVQVPNKGSGDESFWGLNNPGVWGLIREGKFDAVACFTGYPRATFWIARIGAWLSRTAFLFGTDATTLESMDGRKWRKPVKRVMWPLLYRLATQVIVPSDGSRDLILALGLPAERITVTPYAVDNDWWIEKSATVDREGIRQSWGIPSDATAILFCAKLQPWKRPQDLLRAFAQANLPMAYLIFAGDGPLGTELQEEAKKLGITERMRFLGFQNQTQLPAVYRSCDVLVLPSSYDAFGVVVNEASLCGCVVVTSDRVGAARNLVLPVDKKLVYPCGEVGALARILRELATDRAELQRLRAAAKALVLTWSPEANVDAFAEAVQMAKERMGERSR